MARWFPLCGPLRPMPPQRPGAPSTQVEALRRLNDKTVFLYAFDLIELNGDDLRREPFVVRKRTLASLLGDEIVTGLLGSAIPGLRLNEHIEADGVDVFQHACRMGLEGIVSKRKDSYYVSGRSLYWIKSKNPDAPAVKREAEIDWGR